VASLSAALIDTGRPLLDDQLAHPTVRGIAAGDLDPAIFRSWLEQDHLFLLDYVRVFCRLAWQAPDAHVGDLVDLAHSTLHEELALHRSLAESFGADLEGAVKGPACAAYTSFLLESAADYGIGLAALLPCMWGYSTLGRSLPVPDEPRYRRWVETSPTPRSRRWPSGARPCSTRRHRIPSWPSARSWRRWRTSSRSGTCPDDRVNVRERMQP
jgi:thiaminase (transcriptional activator TenA)